jgi:hypothetical protein
MEIIDNMDENNMLKQQMTDQQMTDEERYHITNEVARTKLEDAGGSVGDEIWTYPAVHLFHGKIPEDVLIDMIKYCEETNNDLASDKLVANMEGTQSNLDPDHPLLKGFVEMMSRAACTFVNQCQMNYGKPQKPKRVEIQEIWDVKMQPGDYNPLHIHATKAKEGLSSICYIKIPKAILEAVQEGGSNPKYQYTAKKDGWTQFVWDLKTHTSDFECATNAYVLPKVGDFFIFPKYLSHQVFPFRDEQDRWSVQVNFNIWDEFEEDGLNLVQNKEKELQQQGGVGGLMSGMESPQGITNIEITPELQDLLSKDPSAGNVLKEGLKEAPDYYGRISNPQTQTQGQHTRGDNDTKKVFDTKKLFKDD